MKGPSGRGSALPPTAVGGTEGQTLADAAQRPVSICQNPDTPGDRLTLSPFAPFDRAAELLLQPTGRTLRGLLRGAEGRRAEGVRRARVDRVAEVRCTPVTGDALAIEIDA